jgi:ketosteroid isomerase-like protein
MSARKPVEIHALFEAAFNSGDVEALGALYEPRAILMIDGRIIEGRGEIKKTLGALATGGARMKLETRAVVEQKVDVALLYGRWELESAGGTQSGLSTEVLRRQPDGNWLYVIDNPYTPS